MRLTYSKVKSQCAKVLNLNPSDTRVLDYVNRAQERLVHKGKWVDTYARYAICTSDNCLTWPREIETIEAAALCTEPIPIRNGWYEFLESGPGILRDTVSGSCHRALIDRGNAVTYDDITTTGYTLAIYAEGTEDADATVLIRYYNSSGNKVRTTFNGEVIEGERIVIPDAGDYAYSTYQVLPNGIYHIEKPVTTKPIRLFGYKSADSTYKALGLYEADEELPQYRRSYIPATLSGGTGESCSTTPLTIVGKLRFIPAINDDSLLMVSNIGALVMGCQAVKKEEDNIFTEAATYWAMARAALDEQLAHWKGTGEVAPIRVQQDNMVGGGIFNMI